MATPTKAQALDKFCTRLDFPNQKLVGETKVEFHARKQKEFSLGVVRAQILDELQATAKADLATAMAALEVDLANLDI